ncbi:hypothetical protein GQE99_10230 [Maritimibacter sp. DP07]|uniref:Uncharacterized protein n=1 Tax=Maritimibacter harenae TaxID=2606218 RepID=A0A845M981_9RHOB|nr:hypothetical protein [Maritimibacter harenae]MZR13394.1 hypothetical protein [Maritimibacter harenae]
MPTPLPETTDLERRVRALERILQTLIAYMAQTEPRFIDHLRARFVEPMRMTQHEHDFRSSDEYAEEFIRAVMLLEDAWRVEQTEAATAAKRPVTMTHETVRPETKKQKDRIQLRLRNGIWEVKLDGHFLGDYHKKEYALAAVALLKLSLS